jgi:hypothetical protein
MNKIGPRTEPCGTPQEVEKEDDLWPKVETMEDRERR